MSLHLYPKETLNNFTIQLSDTKYRLGQNIILRATNDNPYDVHYTASFENTMILVGIIMTLIFTMVHYYQLEQMYMKILIFATGNGGAISEPGTYRMKIEVTYADGHIDTMYTAPITLAN